MDSCSGYRVAVGVAPRSAWRSGTQVQVGEYTVNTLVLKPAPSAVRDGRVTCEIRSRLRAAGGIFEL